MSEAPLRVFLDTNVLFSALHSPSGTPSKLLQAAAAAGFQPILSDRVLDELVRNLVRKLPHLLPSLAGLLVNVPFEIVPQPLASAVEIWLKAGLKEDTIIVAAAISARSDYLCTGDRGIHDRADLCIEAGLKLIRPADLIKLLDSGRR